MKIICTMPVRNEDWCLGLTARAALQWCDELVVSDHLSFDKTLEILWAIHGEVGDRLQVIRWTDPVWSEMAQRQALLDKARERSATHIVMVDADEVLTGNLIPILPDLIRRIPHDETMQLPWIQLRGSIARMHTTGVWAEQNVSMAFKDEPACNWTARAGYDFHHRHPMGRPMKSFRPLQPVSGGLMHLQMVSDRRLKAKQALYKMQEVIRWPGRRPLEEIDQMYNLAVYGNRNEAAAIPDWAPRTARAGEVPVPANAFAVTPGPWWKPYVEWQQYMNTDAAPWQEAACVAMMKEHGPRAFEGLDLFGVCG